MNLNFVWKTKMNIKSYKNVNRWLQVLKILEFLLKLPNRKIYTPN